MNLSISELNDLCPFLRRHITTLKLSNKKHRLTKLVEKLQAELDFKEAEFRSKIFYSGVTFKTNNLCPTCKQPKPTSTLSSDN